MSLLLFAAILSDATFSYGGDDVSTCTYGGDDVPTCTYGGD